MGEVYRARDLKLEHDVATRPCRAAYTSYPLLRVNNRPVQPVFERTVTEEPMP